MNMSPSTDHLHHEDYEIYDRTLFGFWLYLMTDSVLFATLFACYAILVYNTFGGPGPADLFHLPFVLGETLLLLSSSFTCGLAMLSARQRNKDKTLTFFTLTLLLGVSFLAMELYEFSDMVAAGNSWQRSAFLSSYFTLVGTHGLHVAFGVLWILVMLYHISTRGITLATLRRLSCLSLYWHFLDIIWIFIFTFVYLIGVL